MTKHDSNETPGADETKPYIDQYGMPGWLPSPPVSRGLFHGNNEVAKIDPFDHIASWLTYIWTSPELIQPGARVRFTRKVQVSKEMSKTDKEKKGVITFEPGEACQVWGYFEGHYLIRPLKIECDILPPQTWETWKEPGERVVLQRARIDLVMVPKDSFEVVMP